MRRRRVQYTRRENGVEQSISIEEFIPSDDQTDTSTSTIAPEQSTTEEGGFERSACGLLFCLSEIPVQLLSRKMSIDRINGGSVAISFTILGPFALIYLLMYHDGNTNDNIGSPESYLVSGLLFAFIILMMFCKMLVWGMSKYKGMEVSNLNFLRKDGWSRLFIRMIAEPSVFIILGIGWFFFNKYAGYVLIASGISVWFRCWCEWAYLKRKFQELDRPNDSKEIILSNP